ncbi:hypothetical protein GW17_00051611 [Ensete ventricosum]|nr:hypothetical protein GW17_00051611 [Ensete ventricosum]
MWSFHAHFPPLLLPPCATPSTIEEEDHSFLRHRPTHLKLPLPTTSPSVGFIAIVVRSFLHRYNYHSQLPMPLLSSVASSIYCCCLRLPLLPMPSSESSSITATLSFPTFHRR